MTDLLQFLLTLDEQLFYFLNATLTAPWCDHLMVWVTNKKNWYLPGGILWLLLMWKGGKKGRTVGVLVVLAIALADQISSTFLKPALARFRPCKVLEGFRLLSHCGSKYGFPSSHASNIAAIGTLFIYHYRRWTPVWAVLIFLIGFSRIYVGVHYPVDVLGGWALGAVISLSLIFLANRLQQRLVRKS